MIVKYRWEDLNLHVIKTLEPKPSASTNSATSTRWSKRNIPHKDITEAYPLSLLYMELNSNDSGGTWTPDQLLRRQMLYPTELLSQETSLFVLLWEAWEGWDLHEVWTFKTHETIIPFQDLIVKWEILDSNQAPHDYQSCALTNWANLPKCRVVVNLNQNVLIDAPLDSIIGFKPRQWGLEGLEPPTQFPLPTELQTLRWAGRDLNPRRQSQWIYSPPPLTTRTPTRKGESTHLR